MNVGELKDLLEGLDDEVEVRLMTQPSWPFEYSVAGTILWSELSGEFHPADVSIDAEDKCEMDSSEDILYLVEGTQLGYGTKDAWSY